MSEPSTTADNQEDDFPGHLLHRAALWDNADLLIDLLNGELKAFINSQDSWGRYPLHAAGNLNRSFILDTATTDCSSCVSILLDAGANPNCTSGAKDNFMTPLHVSAEHGYLSNVQRLVDAGADVNRKDGRNLSPIDLAERGGHASCLEYLKNAATVEATARHNLHIKLRDAAAKCDLKLLKNILESMNSIDIQSIVNETHHGSNTLLFKAAESGNKQLVQLLCENGADSRVHPVTKYSPLYIACYYGHRDVVSLLLEKFPVLIGIPTVEKWLPLHAACINGHAHIVDLILKHNYPSNLFRKYPAPMHPDLEIELPFDFNLKDVSGQTALYIGCQMGNQKLVETLLRHKVPGKKVGEKNTSPPPTEENKANASSPVSPTEACEGAAGISSNKSSPSKKLVISEGIQGIMSKLSLATNQNLTAVGVNLGSSNKKSENMVCPFDINTYCEDYQTALHVAVKSKHHVIVSTLLQNGADPNLPILPLPQANTPYEQVVQSSRKREESSTALVEACLLRDLGMVDLLIKFGATDNECKALTVSAQDDIVVGKILALKAHQDSENKINTQHIKDNILHSMKKPLLVTSILPSSSLTINWHNQKLSRINEQWLISATLKLNPKLRLCPKNQGLGLQAITRLDMSSNSLESIPPIIFTFCSLVYLNLSQNKIRQLEFPAKIDVPKLQEIFLNENRIEICPPQLFHFPALTTINLANNKLRQLPSSVWDSPNLQELNVSLNLLTDLPPLDGESSDQFTSIVFDSLPYIPAENIITSETSTPSTMSPLSPDTVFVPSGRSFLLANDALGNGRTSPLMTHHAMWRQRLKVGQNPKETNSANQSLANQKDSISSSLLYLNLSHNSFCKIPKVLVCLAPTLQRLNLSYNGLRYMGHIGYYPASLRQLDVSHNNIDKWFYTPSTVDSPGGGKGAHIRLQCFAKTCLPDFEQGEDKCCTHKKHIRLELLKSLVLGGNQLKNIQVGGNDLSGDDAWLSSVGSGDKRSAIKSLWFPNVTLLDISDNALTEVTVRIAELKSLSVLNLSGNYGITDLPPELGTLKHLWNLNLSGCSLQEPLLSMIERKRCKTMDIIGYLKSILEDAKPYSRMKLMIVGVSGIGKTTILQQMRQETSSSQQRHIQQQDHWAKRMSFQFQSPSSGSTKSSSGSGIQKSGKPISTVGVDIASWALEPKVHRGSGHGPVIFRTWDFGGQKEYYATHLYFLSKRSLYLVVWNICDGEKALNEIVMWLVNIQARAPNSPVIIVGTHYDLVNEKFPPGYLDYLQQKIREKFIRVTDPEKRGLPRVLHSIEVSCKTRHNIRYLTNLLYETVWSLKTNNGKILLEQKVPAKYIHLEEITAYLAQERKSQGLEPVLAEHEFKVQASNWLQKGFNLTFRDDAEIMQACSFLHENGILLHFEDSVLHDLYFLDPQSLCDMLANVVTIREINPFAKNGIMRIDDLNHLFKGKSSITKEYILSLLSKFELAVPIDKPNCLLIPSLLPTYEQMKTGQYDVKISIPIRPKRWNVDNRRGSQEFSTSSSSIISPTKAPTPAALDEKSTSSWTIEKGKLIPLSRFVLLSYFPSGFWSRLISRILSDDRIVEIIRNYFTTLPISPSRQTFDLINSLSQQAEWSLWQNGLEINYGPLNILYVKEVTGEKPFSFMLRRDETLCEIVEPSRGSGGDLLNTARNSDEPEEQVWEVVDLSETSLLEIHLQADSLRLASDEPEHSQTLLEPSIENVTKILALVVDHIDMLLEDWYPSVGTRFVHTSEGKYLVTRLIPCPRCFPNQQGNSGNDLEQRQQQHRQLTNSPDTCKSPRMSTDSGINSPTATKLTSSIESSTSPSTSVEIEDKDAPTYLRTRTGLVFETPKFGTSITSSSSYMSGLNYFLKPETRLRNLTRNMYSWTVEHCILESQRVNSGAPGTEIIVKCPKHGGIPLSEVAPDILFLDLNRNSILKMDDIQRDKLLGRGAFGFVFGGTLRLHNKNNSKNSNSNSTTSNSTEIAIKMFQPVNPTVDGDKSSDNKSESMNEAQLAYKLAFNKWHRSPSQSACRAYSACRGEVRVLYWVHHEQIVPFLGLCQLPLSIVLRKAPLGALNKILGDFKRSGDHLKEETLRASILQVASALEYLHRNHIIYRDLKSENVLVWSFPGPFAIRDIERVDIKLADYGISRTSFAMGFSKGFGGTEGYMAPEIIRYNGEEEYTEKADIFSFGMLIYELISLTQPFDNCDNIKESILEGDRPSLTQKECSLYPLYILDLMVSCWSNAPNDRPSAAQIVTIASSTEFLVLRDVVTIGNVTNIVTSIGIEYGFEKEIWTSCSTGGIYCLKLGKSESQFESCHCFEFITGVVTAMCQINVDTIWMGDTRGKIHSLRVSDYGKITEIDMEAQVGPCGAITCIESVGSSLAAIVVSSGRLFLCDPNINNGQVISELGNAAVIHCLTCRGVGESEYEIWAGEKAGQMTIFTIKNNIVVQQETINHYEKVLEGVQVLIVKSHSSQNILFSYVYPGSVIYGWDSENREMIARLDVGKLLPLRDTTMDDLSQKPLQVTLIYSTKSQVYIGTNWGFIFITDIKYLKPLTILQPFQEDIRSFWIFQLNQTEDVNSRRNSIASTTGSETGGGRGEELTDENRSPRNRQKIISVEVGSASTDCDNSTSALSNAENCENDDDDLNQQLVIVLGKGFTNIIQQNILDLELDDQRKKRVFAILWKINASSSWN